MFAALRPARAEFSAWCVPVSRHQRRRKAGGGAAALSGKPKSRCKLPASASTPASTSSSPIISRLTRCCVDCLGFSGLSIGYGIDWWLESTLGMIGGSLFFIVAGLYQVVKESPDDRHGPGNPARCVVFRYRFALSFAAGFSLVMGIAHAPVAPCCSTRVQALWCSWRHAQAIALTGFCFDETFLKFTSPPPALARLVV